MAFAAMGAGLIHLGVASGAALSASVVLVVLGFAEFGWGIGVMALNRYPAVRIAAVVALVPSIGWAAMLVIAVAFALPRVAAQFPVFPMAVASLFTLAIALVLALHLRHREPGTVSSKTVAHQPSRPALYLLGLMVGALMVSSLTTPALAATRAGDVNPHKNHAVPMLPEEHGNH